MGSPDDLGWFILAEALQWSDDMTVLKIRRTEHRGTLDRDREQPWCILGGFVRRALLPIFIRRHRSAAIGLELS